MICEKCNWENDDDFKFCLGCGTQLFPKESTKNSTPPKEEAGVHVDHVESSSMEEIKTLHSLENIVEEPPAILSPEESLSEPFELSQTQESQDNSSSPLILSPKNNEISSKTIESSEFFSADKLTVSEENPPTQEEMLPFQSNVAEKTLSEERKRQHIIERTCTDCLFENPGDNKFCGQCGNALGTAAAIPTTSKTETIPSSSSMSTHANLVLLLPNGQEGGRYPLKGNQTILGRKEGNILFLDDPYISPVHAVFERKSANELWIKDQKSLNGLFLRIVAKRGLKNGDLLLLGKQLLRFEVLPSKIISNKIEEDKVREEQPVSIWGSPWGRYWGRLVQLIEGGKEGNAVLLGGQTIEIGRENGHITFPNDRFISGLHARISLDNSRPYLEDLGSRNGTFLQLKSPYLVQNNDSFIIGEQLLKIELTHAS